jgi:hypothetical protein
VSAAGRGKRAVTPPPDRARCSTQPFPTIASVIQRQDSRPISGQWSVQFRPLVPITGA